MTFEDSLSLLASRVVTNWEQTETEEATKTAFILPFISTVLAQIRDLQARALAADPGVTVSSEAAL